ncbi:MAG: TetR/AcrR family transcriptional regulator, partial [Candidatus Geothermincolia bacterium]
TSIIDAAKELFSQKGYQATTMDEIAEKAELSKGAVYLYFESKDDLYVSLIVEEFWTIEGRLAEVIDSEEDLISKGKSMYMAFVKHCLENEYYVKINQYFLTEGAQRNISANLVKTIGEQTSRLMELISRMVEEGKITGRIREDLDPIEFGLVAWRMTVGLLELAFSQDIHGLGVDGNMSLFETAYDILIGGIRPAA